MTVVDNSGGLLRQYELAHIAFQRLHEAIKHEERHQQDVVVRWL